MSRRHYPAGSLVLAKVRGFPPWPAEVVDPVQFDQEPKKDKIFVFFFQPRQVRFCMPEEVTPFAGEAREAAITRTKGKSCLADFKVALAEALEEEKRRPPLPPEEDEDEAAEEEEDMEEDAVKKIPHKRVHTAEKPSAQKRTKIDAGWKTPKRTAAKPPKPRSTARATGTANGDNTTGESLIEIVKQKGKGVDQAAYAWVERYTQNQAEALAELLTFLFHACGAHYTMKPEDPSDETDVDDIVQNMVHAAKEGDVEDLLGSKLKELKNFKQNLLQFWHALVLECQDTVLFDERLVNKVTSYVIALACTSPRTFRHVATLVALQLVTSFVAVATSFIETRETMQRQLNAETKKKAVGPRMESLTKSLADINEKITSIEEMMRKLFTGVFMHRYRDVDAEIRVACISSLGVWIENYPSLFLQDLYLKYIGWTLNDKVAAVRQSSINALCKLYDNEEFIPALGLFTERFLTRMIELADDVDIGVAVKAINLLQELMRHELIGEEDVVPLYELLFDESAQVRQAIGKIIYEQRVAPASSSSGTGSASKAGREKRGFEGQLSAVLQLLAEYSTTPVLAAYVIDALGDIDAMQDWKCMTKMLLNEQSSEELSNEDATNLIRMLNVSIKKAVGEKIVPVAETKKHITKTLKDSFEAHRQALTTVLMKPLPQLLRKFLADGAKVASLVDIIFHLDLEMFSIKRHESSFSMILQLLREAFFKHGDMEVLQGCAKALSFCAKEGHAELKDVSRHVLNDTGKEVVKKLRETVEQVADLEEDVEKEYSLIVNMRRSYQFQMVADISSDECFNCIASLLDDYNTLDDEMVSLALVNLFPQITWSFATLNVEEPREEAMAVLVAKRAKLMEHLEASLEGLLESPFEGSARMRLAGQVVDMLSDLWCLFSKAKLQGSKLDDLGYEPRDALLRNFWKLCEQLLESPEPANGEEEEYSSATFSKEFVMAAAAKLVAFNMVPKDFLAPEIVSHFVLHNKGVADMVKTLCNKLKQSAQSTDQSDLYLEALKRAYGRHVEEVGDEDREQAMNSQSYHACKELASRLSAMYIGFGRAGNRGSILKIVAEGLHFAFADAPKQLPFLEAGVVQFALKLGPEDLRKIITEAERRVEGVNMDEDPSAWRPYTRMMEQLKEKAAKADPHAAERQEPPSRRGRPRKAHDLNGKRLSYAEKAVDEDEIEEEGAGPSQEEEEEEDDEDEGIPLDDIRRSRKVPQARARQASGAGPGSGPQRQTPGPAVEESQSTPAPPGPPQTGAAAPLQYSRKRKAPRVPESPIPPFPAGPEATAEREGAGAETETETEMEAGTQTETEGGTPTQTQTPSEEEMARLELRSKAREDQPGGREEGAEEETPGETETPEEEAEDEAEEDDVDGTEEVFPGSFTATEEQLPGPSGKRPKFTALYPESEETGFESEAPTQSSPAPSDPDLLGF